MDNLLGQWVLMAAAMSAGVYGCAPGTAGKADNSPADQTPSVGTLALHGPATVTVGECFGLRLLVTSGGAESTPAAGDLQVSLAADTGGAFHLSPTCGDGEVRAMTLSRASISASVFFMAQEPGLLTLTAATDLFSPGMLEVTVLANTGCGGLTCTEHAACSDRGSATAHCACDAGWEGDGTSSGSGCVDVDECIRDVDDCIPTATCTNAPGTFSCACNGGWLGDGRAAGSGCAPNLVQNPGFEADFTSWTHSHFPATSGGVEAIVSDGCESGKCLTMSHNDSSWQGTVQRVGTLKPGATYALRVRFKAPSGHLADINLYDAAWRDASCSVIHLSLRRLVQGSGDWQDIAFMVRVPERDACGPTDSHAWDVILYSFSPLTSTAAIFYDDISLSEVAHVPEKELEEQTLWMSAECRTFTTGLPLAPCPPAAKQFVDGPAAGHSSIVLQGQRDQQRVFAMDWPVKPATLYGIGVRIKVSDRQVYSYLELPYPSEYVQQRPGIIDRVEQTRGVWGGKYELRVGGANILPPAIWDAPYRSASDLDWYEERSFFRTGPHDARVTVQAVLTGLDGKITLDGLSLWEASSSFDERYLHIPASTAFGGMRITAVQSYPPAVETNSARFSFDSRQVIMEWKGVEVGRLTFPDGLLARLSPITEVGNVYLANDNVQLSVGADGVMLAKLLTPAVVSLSGARPLHHAFVAGNLFATDGSKGIYFGPLRPATDLKKMPRRLDPALARYDYFDEDFAAAGTKTWELQQGFDQDRWRIDYDFRAGEAFFVEVFPPKERDPQKACKERLALLRIDTAAHPDATFAYDLQKAGERSAFGLLWMNAYASTPNRLAPVEETCVDAANLYVPCSSPSVARHVPLGWKVDVAGPFEVVEPAALRAAIAEAHSRNIKLLIYMSPQYYYTSDASVLLDNLMRILDEYGLDGVYFDGLYEHDVLRSLELMRRARSALGDRFLALHVSWNNYAVFAADQFRVPALDAWADRVWLGEGIKDASDATWRYNFCSVDVSNTPSTLLGELRPVDYSAGVSREASLALTLTPQEQIARMLACGGQYSGNTYSYSSIIVDSRYQYSIAYPSDELRGPLDAACLPATCSDGVCDAGETLFSCPEDCRPPLTGAALSYALGSWRCDTTYPVGQWLVDGKPRYLLRLDLGSMPVQEISGLKMNPRPALGVTERAPILTKVDGRAASLFGGGASVFGETDRVLDLTGRSFTALARFKAADGGTGRQVLFGLNPGKSFYIGLDGSRPVAVLSKSFGTETLVAADCHAGQCVRAEHKDATYQGIVQPVHLEPGSTLHLSAWCRTSASHQCHVRLHTNAWRNAACQTTSTGFETKPFGNDGWQQVSVDAVIPALDACGQATTRDWFVILYGQTPVTDASPVYYDDLSLVRVDQPTTELLANPGFESGFRDWTHDSYVPPTEIFGQTDLRDGRWHTLGLVVSPPHIEVHVDGIERVQQDVPLGAFPTFGTYAVGSAVSGGGRNDFDGYISDAVIFDRALSQADIETYHLYGSQRLSESEAAVCVVRTPDHEWRTVAP